jgi:hypothetical protein
MGCTSSLRNEVIACLRFGAFGFEGAVLQLGRVLADREQELAYQSKYSKAVESLTANWERLVTFFDFPAEHWPDELTVHQEVAPM